MLESFTLTDLSGNAGFLQWVQKVTSVGCKLFDFDPCCLFWLWLTTNFPRMYCYFNLVGQLCLGDPGYSSRTVNLKSDAKHHVSHHNIYPLGPVCTMIKNRGLCLQKIWKFGNLQFFCFCNLVCIWDTKFFLQPETSIKEL